MYYKKVGYHFLTLCYISNIWNKTFLLNTIDNNNQSIPRKSKETPRIYIISWYF